MSQQLIDFARAERDAAMRRVAERAEEASPGWTDVALSFLGAYARKHAVFSSEEVSEAAVAWGLVQPHDARAWGPVYLRAQRQWLITRSDQTYRRAKGHASLVHASLGVKWKSLVFSPTGGR